MFKKAITVLKGIGVVLVGGMTMLVMTFLFTGTVPDGRLGRLLGLGLGAVFLYSLPIFYRTTKEIMAGSRSFRVVFYLLFFLIAAVGGRLLYLRLHNF